ncbi:MAG: HPF/RaiA family ribosome-associated protein [Anaerolineae bacterium]|nr:HPF/RaiA family ribosome-associated protein [Anaerolineae bacterium]
MSNSQFNLELHNGTAYPDDPFRREAALHIEELCKGHDDITDAAVALEELSGDETPHVYQARVILYVRPNDVIAVIKEPDPMMALKAALDAVERQVREQREKLSETWSQP